jgi:ketosteroid isomerase-like protein
MSQENVERLRAAIDAYNREGPEAIIAFLDPDVEWVADRSDLGRVTYRGRDGVRKAFAEQFEGLDRLGFEIDELIDRGDQIVALGQLHGRGRSTGIEGQSPLAIVFTVGGDGKIIRYESFRNAQEALEAVGLSE